MGSKSKSKTSTTSTYYDQRQVNDAAGGVVGTGNTQDQSIRLTDSSRTDNSIRYSDNSRTSVSTYNTTTDQGAVRAAVDMTEAAMTSAGKLGSQAFVLGRGAIDGAYKSSSDALDFGRDTLEEVVGLARDVVGQAGTQSQAAQAIVAGAYTDAADSASGDRTLKLAGLAAVALVAAGVGFAALRK